MLVPAPSGRSTREQMIKVCFFEGLQYGKSMKEMKAKFYLETLILLLIKRTGMREIKHKDFTDIFPKVHTDIKIAKINHIMVSFTDN